jgi:hypothetical protein
LAVQGAKPVSASKQTRGVTGSIARHRLDLDHVIMSTSIVGARFTAFGRRGGDSFVCDMTMTKLH